MSSIATPHLCPASGEMLEQHVETEMKGSFRELSLALAGVLAATTAVTAVATAAPDSEQLELSAHPHAWSDRIKDLDGNGEKPSHTFAAERPPALRNGPGPLHNDIVKL